MMTNLHMILFHLTCWLTVMCYYVFNHLGTMTCQSYNAYHCGNMTAWQFDRFYYDRAFLECHLVCVPYLKRCSVRLCHVSPTLLGRTRGIDSQCSALTHNLDSHTHTTILNHASIESSVLESSRSSVARPLHLYSVLICNTKSNQRTRWASIMVENSSKVNKESGCQ